MHKISCIMTTSSVGRLRKWNCLVPFWGRCKPTSSKVQFLRLFISIHEGCNLIFSYLYKYHRNQFL